MIGIGTAFAYLQILRESQHQSEKKHNKELTRYAFHGAWVGSFSGAA